MHHITPNFIQGSVNKDFKMNLQVARLQSQFRAIHVLPLCYKGRDALNIVTSAFCCEGHMAEFFHVQEGHM